MYLPELEVSFFMIVAIACDRESPAADSAAVRSVARVCPHVSDDG